MFTCKLCGKKLEKIGNHITAKHKISSLEYFEVYIEPTYNISAKYIKGLSGTQICKEISLLTNGLIKPIKKQIMEHLRKNNIPVRSTSEATKCWVESIGGVWNKGETKSSHPSVQKYADSRIGKDNPYYKTDPVKRIDTYYQRIPVEDANALRTSIGKQIQAKYQSGDLIHWSKTDPQKAIIAKEKTKATWGKKAQAGVLVSHPYYPISAMERKVGFFLSEMGEAFETQRSLGYYSYDYVLVNKKIVLEYNGTYWHCDPRIYQPDFWHSKKKKFAYQIWEKDEKKKQIAQKAGYVYLAIWEYDLQRMTDEQIKQYLADSIKNCVVNTHSS